MTIMPSGWPGRRRRSQDMQTSGTPHPSSSARDQVSGCDRIIGTHALALAHSELMAQHEDLGILPPPLPARQPKQRHDTGDDKENQLQPHKPKIIPRPRSPRRAEQPATSGASGQVAQVVGTYKSRSGAAANAADA